MELPLHQQFQDMIHHILHIFFYILYVYLSINIFYLLIASIAGHFRNYSSFPVAAVKKNIAVLITSYREDDVIITTVAEASAHNYPKQSYRVFLAADHLNDNTLKQLQKLNVTVNILNSKKSSKARSLNSLLNSIDETKFDIALVLDGDNIMLPGFLEKINAAFQHEYHAVQAHRTAKNKNSSVAILDALSEEVNNHLFRRSQRAMGFSSTLIGSGMAFDFKKLKQIYNKPGILDNPACDRVVDFEMMKEGITIEYLEDATLLDEKVAKTDVYERQRRRWLESQAMHVKLFFSLAEYVTKKNRDYWNKLFINLMPPRILLFFIVIIMLIIAVFEYFMHVQFTRLPIVACALLLAFYLIAILLSVPRSFFNSTTLKAVLSLPLLMLTFAKAATGVRFGRKEFVHTPKSYTGDHHSPDQ